MDRFESGWWWRRSPMRRKPASRRCAPAATPSTRQSPPFAQTVVDPQMSGEGYRVVRSPHSYTFGYMHGIRCRDGRLDGGTDPRREGIALSA
jgi:gamma-glutamyltranspeptidase